MKIGKLVRQPEGFSAFIPAMFPPKKNGFSFSSKILKKVNQATLLLGKLDGIAHLLPDVDFFIFMYIRKDAAASSQIEGTMATMVDAIEAESKTSTKYPADVGDILHYIDALNFGIERIKKFPLSLRFIRELHEKLMSDARATHFCDPGNFRKSQNWIGGTTPQNARFVPPPVFEMNRALADLEKFLHDEDSVSPVLKAGIAHAQFETIHPFLDGNGRTGRLLMTFYFTEQKILERPILFLSSFFKKHQKLYYEKTQKYHENDPESWCEFYLDGVIEVANDAIQTVKEITDLRERDILKIQKLNKTASESAAKVLPELFALPIINTAKIMEWTGFTRAGAGNLINRFVDLGILKPRHKDKKYGQSFEYFEYLKIFQN